MQNHIQNMVSTQFPWSILISHKSPTKHQQSISKYVQISGSPSFLSFRTCRARYKPSNTGYINTANTFADTYSERITSRLVHDLFIGWWVCFRCAPAERAVCADFVRVEAGVSTHRQTTQIDTNLWVRGLSDEWLSASGFIHWLRHCSFIYIDHHQQHHIALFLRFSWTSSTINVFTIT